MSGGGGLIPPDGERIVALEGRVSGVEADTSAIKHDVHELRVSTDRGFKELNERLISRPSWAVVTYITFTTSGCVGLAVALLSKI
jgi:hypothetical protein